MKEDKGEAQFLRLYEDWEKHLQQLCPQLNKYQANERFWEDNKTALEALNFTKFTLQHLRCLRNTCAHNASYIEIKQKALSDLRQLVRHFCRTAERIAIPGDQVYSASPDHTVREVIKEMARKLYTHVPIVHEGEFVGVFSENTLLRLVAERRDIETLKIREIDDKYLRETEGSDDYEFVRTDTAVHELFEMFRDYIGRGDRLGVVFLTEDGEESGDLKGLITAWDMNKDPLQVL